jgi:hypothetical protein
MPRLTIIIGSTRPGRAGLPIEGALRPPREPIAEAA